MSSKNKTPNYQSKKSAVLNQTKYRLRPLPVALVCLIAVAVVAGVYISQLQGEPATASSTLSKVTPDDTGAVDAIYPISTFEDGLAHYFEHKANGVNIRYFILKSSDGIIRAAFDACDVCWPAGKGYQQVGDEMVCRNCGRRFASVLINEVNGGCNPAPLKRSVKDGNLIIKVDDILNGRNYFNFKEKA